MLRSAGYWIREYNKRDALWIHDGNAKRPHALLTSGKHSGGFFNSRPIISDEPLLGEAAFHLAQLFFQQGGDPLAVQGIIGPQTGATKLANYIRLEFYYTTGLEYFSLSPAKSTEGEKRMIFSKTDHESLRDMPVLLCEDVLTTGGSVELTAAAVEDAGGIVLPSVLVLVNRSGLTEVSGRKIIALIDSEMPIWEPHECPLCKQGSEALRPKDNWARLNADY